MEVYAPFNNVIVKFDTKYIRNFSSIAKIASIQNDTSIEPADFVNILCTVISRPRGISTKREYTGFSASDIEPGDKAIVSHNVIFDFSPTLPEEEPIFKNRLWYMGEEYFLCDIKNIFAVIRDTKIRMQNGYVMVQDMEKPSLIVMPAHLKKRIKTYSATIAHIGKPLESETRIDAEVGDIVYYNPQKLNLYQIGSVPYGILRQSDILGKTVRSYGDSFFLN